MDRNDLEKARFDAAAAEAIASDALAKASAAAEVAANAHDKYERLAQRIAHLEARLSHLFSADDTAAHQPNGEAAP
jgi:ubiquinone biosynthesis protein UbiJ